MSSPDQLAVLGLEQRNDLEALLMDFEQSWTPQSLDDYCARLSTYSSQPFREAALAELVKIDLHRQWSVGTGRLLEAYLDRIPALGATDGVSPQLILAEFEARRIQEADLALATYRQRFPKQFEQFAELAERVMQSRGLSSPTGARPPAAQASIDTSRIEPPRDTNAGPESAFSSALPAEFGRYRILRELGRGAMGSVHLAHDSQLDRQVAIKTPVFSGAGHEAFVERFYREARAAAKLQHRNICPVYDVGEIDGRHFISMAFVKGRCMSEFIKPDKLPPQKTSAILILRLALALAEAHRRNVIHRDLKPANIMIDTKREPVVMDFGLARQMDVESRMTQTGMAVGTPAYMSPEQVRGEQDEVGPAVDIYALGVIFYELLTGQLPFRGQIAQVVYGIVNEEPVPPSKLRSEISPELEAVCVKMLAKRPQDRFQSMEQVAEVIKDHLNRAKKREKTAAAPRAVQRKPKGDPTLDSHSETGALNAFFAAQALQNPTPSSVDLRTSSASTPLLKPLTRIAAGSGGRRIRWLIVGLASVFLVAAALGIVFFAKTPYGTLRIETVGELDGLEVLVDGKTINLKEPKSTRATDHELQLKLGDTYLELDPTTRQFVLSRDGEERRISVSIGAVELSGKNFTVARDGETILKIALLTDNASSIAASPSDDHGLAIESIKNPETSERVPTGFTSLFAKDSAASPTTKTDLSKFPQLTIDAQADMRQMALAPDGRIFAATGTDTPGEVTIWDAVNGTRLRRFRVSDGDIWSLSFSKDGNFLLFPAGRSVSVVAIKDGELVRKLHFPSLVSIATFPQRNWVACLLFETPATKEELKSDPPTRIVSIWDWEANTKLEELAVKRIGNQAAYWPAISPDEKFLTLGMRHLHTRYDIVTNGDAVTLENQTALEKTSLVRGPLVFSPDGRLAATTRKDRNSLFAVLDIRSGRVLREVDAERASSQGMGSRLAFTADGRRIVVSDMEGGVSLWNCETGQLIRRLYSHQKEEAKYGPPGLLVTPDHRIITGGGPHDRRIMISQLPESP